jgi:dinuclear metal center YbgI/SA1388 family protein
MPCLLTTLVRYVDDLLVPSNFQDGCVNGIQVEGKKTIKHIATAVTASEAVIRRAASVEADCLLVHHGLFLKGKDVVVTGSMKPKLAFLLAFDMTLLGYHLPLDAHHELGNNWAAAKLLGLNELEPFGKFQGAMVGVKGVMPAISRELFKKRLEKFYGRKAECAFGGKKLIKSCAIISGGAHKWIHEAIQDELDCFVTGTSDEPIWHAAFEEKINFYALGHAATERIGVKLLGDHLAEEFNLIHTNITDNNPF